MPNRIIKESIWTSPNLNALSPLAELHFYKLLPLTDDWGCFEATPLVVKGICYPLRAATPPSSILMYQKELSDNGLIKMWSVGGRDFAEFVLFEKHNGILNRHSPKTPCPPWRFDDKGLDTRLSTETLQAYKHIGVARVALEKQGEKATYRQICKAANCSMSTLSKYYKHTQKEGCYALLQPATDATHKNPNPTPRIKRDVAGKNDKRNVSKKEFADESVEFKLAHYLFELILRRNPNHKKPNLQAWSRHIDLMIRVDKRDPANIKRVIKWCQEDTPGKQAEGRWRGWANNILSTKKLREKFDVLAIRMKETTDTKQNPLPCFGYQPTKEEFLKNE